MGTRNQCCLQNSKEFMKIAAPPGRGAVPFTCFECGLHSVNSLPKNRGRKGTNSNSTVRGEAWPTRPSPSDRGSHHQECHLDLRHHPPAPYNGMGRVHHLCDILSRNTQPRSNYKKSIRQTQSEGHSTKHLTSTAPNCQGHEKYGTSENLSQSLRRHND